MARRRSRLLPPAALISPSFRSGAVVSGFTMIAPPSWNHARVMGVGSVLMTRRRAVVCTGRCLGLSLSNETSILPRRQLPDLRGSQRLILTHLQFSRRANRMPTSYHPLLGMCLLCLYSKVPLLCHPPSICHPNGRNGSATHHEPCGISFRVLPLIETLPEVSSCRPSQLLRGSTRLVMTSVRRLS